MVAPNSLRNMLTICLSAVGTNTDYALLTNWYLEMIGIWEVQFVGRSTLSTTVATVQFSLSEKNKNKSYEISVLTNKNI